MKRLPKTSTFLFYRLQSVNNFVRSENMCVKLTLQPSWYFKDELTCTAWTWTNEKNDEISVGGLFPTQHEYLQFFRTFVTHILQLDPP